MAKCIVIGGGWHHCALACSANASHIYALHSIYVTYVDTDDALTELLRVCQN
jgi:hypothetical protein